MPYIYRYKEKIPKEILIMLFPSKLLYFLCLIFSPYCSGLSEECISNSFSEFIKIDFGGLSCLLSGWIAIPEGMENASWLANPCIFLCWRAFRKNNKLDALGYSLAAIFFIMLFLLGDKVVDTESGSHGQIVRYDLGYWLWLASAIAAFVAAMRMKSTEEPESTD